MQPGANELLTGIKQTIVNALLPELQTEQARGQAMYTIVVIDHLIARWDIEGSQLLEEHAELRALLAQALDTLGEDTRLRDALDAAGSISSGPRALDAENERMRSLIPALARDLPAGSNDPRILELDAAIRRYIRHQHRRDQQIVQVGAVGW